MGEGEEREITDLKKKPGKYLELRTDRPIDPLSAAGIRLGKGCGLVPGLLLDRSHCERPSVVKTNLDANSAFLSRNPGRRRACESTEAYMRKQAIHEQRRNGDVPVDTSLVLIHIGERNT